MEFKKRNDFRYCFNPNIHDSIWSEENMPCFFREKVTPDCLDAKKYYLIVFFTKTCGACIA